LFNPAAPSRTRAHPTFSYLLAKNGPKVPSRVTVAGLAQNAAGPLAASQPGFTILDPLSAALLGVFLFGEHVRTGPWDLAGEVLALTLVIAGAVGLSRSCFILGEFGDPSCLAAGFRARSASRKLPAMAAASREAAGRAVSRGARPDGQATRRGYR
jgi:hypothetical protein